MSGLSETVTIEVFRNNNGKLERAIYTLPIECDVIIVDEAVVHKRVWGFLRGKHDDPHRQVEGTLQTIVDGMLYG